MNIFTIKRGSGTPGEGVLEDGELGFDKEKQNLYIGMEITKKDKTKTIEAKKINLKAEVVLDTSNTSENSRGTLKLY